MALSEQHFDREQALAIVATETEEEFNQYLEAQFAGSEPPPGSLLGAAAYATTPDGQDAIKRLRTHSTPIIQTALDTVEQTALTDGVNELEARLEHKRVTTGFQAEDAGRKERQTMLDGLALENQEHQTNSILRGTQERSTFDTAIILPGSTISDCNVERSLIQRGVFSASNITNSLFDVRVEPPKFYMNWDDDGGEPSTVSHSRISKSQVATMCDITNSIVHESQLAKETNRVRQLIRLADA